MGKVLENDPRPAGRSGKAPASRVSSETLPFALWQNLRAHLVWVYEGRPIVTHGRTHRRYFSVWYLRQGQLKLGQGSGATHIGRGTWLLLPPGEDERAFSADAQILSLSFDAQWVTGENWLALNAPLALPPAQTEGWYAAALPMLKIIRRDFAGAYNSLPATPATFLQYAELQGHFLRWLNALIGAVVACGAQTRPLLVTDDRALRIRDYLETFPLEQGLRIEQLAAAFQLSVSQLNRIFYAHFGCSPRAHFEQLRHQRALTLLAEGDAPIKEIAFALGFRHASQLSSWFRAKQGCTPLQYRQTPARGLSGKSDSNG